MTIPEKRQAMGLTQKQLAEEFQVCPTAWSRYENGSRKWPVALLPKVLERLKMAPEVSRAGAWTWARHRQFARMDQWAVEVEAGPTWDKYSPGYYQFYRRLKPKRPIPLDFKRLVRMDSRLEGCVYCWLSESGAEFVLVSLAALGFPHHPLVDAQGKPMSMARRAAFFFEGWLIFPQVHMLVNGQIIRVDALAFNGLYWKVLEFDGGAHKDRTWDQTRDSWLIPETIRFTDHEILQQDFPELLRQRLKPAQASVAS
ncbi:MAG: hypothetical protein KF760_06215 [Candidatus Eremiobacteraeota bacterium]|nr:hypothetical protein [Candidatus Eremiobacteraeota bacterium]MCW5872878.1 hypothetical protein [Candidatus Eremiobacteraeota bacterium]